MLEHDTIAPHGGTLVDLLATEAEAVSLASEARHYPKVQVGERELSDLEMLTVGALSPLTGFQGEKDYRSILETMHLTSGLPWSIPVTLSIDEQGMKGVGRADAVALVAREDADPLAFLRLHEVFRRDRETEARAVFGTEDLEHPGVKALHDAGDWCLAGEVRALHLPEHDTFQGYRMTPRETRDAFRERGWKRVVGFQTRNPVHRAHEYIQKCALEIVDGLLLHPLVGATKEDDVPAEVRMRCYEILFQNYYPKDRAMMSVFPAAMRYAGPKEAIWHAICRKNYGCTHFIVGRDHAGVGTYYGTYEAQKVFESFEADELGITPLFFEHSFYCLTCEGMASPKTCPHDDQVRVILSGTKVREMLRKGDKPPPEFSRPEVAEILIEAMRA
jgi:sulfate adenylyltransferase